MTLKAPRRQWELGPYLPVSDGLGLGMGWVWGEEWQNMERQWLLHRFWANYRGDLWGGGRGAILLLYIEVLTLRSVFWLTLALERQFLQLSTIAIHNTAPGRCIPPERTRARIVELYSGTTSASWWGCIIKRSLLPFPAHLFISLDYYLLRADCVCCHHFKHRGYSREKNPALSLRSSGRR